MWKNFFYIALRSIRKNKLFSLINIAGLAIGLASAIMIILFIAKELSFDRFHEKSDNIYRIYMDGTVGGQEIRGAWTSYAMGPTLTKESESVIDFVRLDIYPQQLVWHNDVKQIEDLVIFVDSSFFNVFSIKLLHGDPDKVLSNPNSVVITKEKALQYFGTENPLGQRIEFNNPGNFYEVTGVMEDFPDNSHFISDFLLSMANIEESRSDIWLSNSIYTYLLLKDGVKYRDVEREMNKILMEKIGSQIEEYLKVSPEDWLEGGNEYGIYLQPITDIHLNPGIEIGGEPIFRPVNDRNYIYVFSLIALFILLIAGINFMNLSTARSAVRSREIAMRKVVGSKRQIIILQFLLESIIFSFLALVFALLIVELTLPYFNKVMGLELSFDSLGKGLILSGVVAVTFLLGLSSGVYPAFYLSQYDPLYGLLGGSLKGRRSVLFRSLMVIVQFTISVAIIVGTLVVYKQVAYLVNMDQGFDDDKIIVMERVYPLGDSLAFFCDEVEKIPGVAKASNSTTYLGFSNTSISFQMQGEVRANTFMFDLNIVDPDFFETYGLTIWNGMGHFFNQTGNEDTMAVIINETAVKEYQLNDPLGVIIQSPSADSIAYNYEVVGVVSDFHHSSLRKTITPYVFGYKTPTDNPGYISIRFEDGVIYKGPTIKKINQLWSRLTGDEPFQYFPLDKELDTYYREEIRTGRISLVFSILAVIIACLGMVGLTIFNTERRMKEIAIRKAMGASMYELMMIISREILLFLVISIVIAWIIAFFFMRHWLQVFPYNIGFTPGLYFIAALVAVAVTMITVNIITLRAAGSNPAETLYHE